MTCGNGVLFAIHSEAKVRDRAVKEASKSICHIWNKFLNVTKSAPDCWNGTFCMQRNCSPPSNSEMKFCLKRTVDTPLLLVADIIGCGCLSPCNTQHRTYLYILLILKLNHNFIIASSKCAHCVSVCMCACVWSTTAGSLAAYCGASVTTTLSVLEKCKINGTKQSVSFRCAPPPPSTEKHT